MMIYVRTILLLVAILVVAALLFRNDSISKKGELSTESITEERDVSTGSEELSEGLSIEERTTQTEETPHSEEANSDSEYLRIMTQFNRSRSALDEDRVISEAEALGWPVAKDWRLNIDVMCHPEQIAFVAADESRNSFAAKYREYCDDYSPTADLFIDGLSEYSLISGELHRTQEIDRLSGLNISNDPDERTRQLNQLIRGARFEEDVLAVSYYISQQFQEEGILLWNPVSEVPPVQPSRLVELQGFSLELYSCWRFGRCGPESPKTITNCAVVDICEPWWSYTNFLAASLPPYEFEYVEDVARRIGMSR